MDLVKAAIAERPFQQLSLMSENQFDSFLRDRGLSAGVEGLRSLVRLGVIEVLDDSAERFHPFQIWPISRLTRRLTISPDFWIRFQSLAPQEKRLENSISIDGNQELTDFAESDFCIQFNRRLLPLLLWIESCFLPVVRGPRPNVVLYTGFDYSSWVDWVRSLPLPSILDEHSVTVQGLSSWRQRILSDAYFCDPSPDLYLLLRSIPFDLRNRRLRGSLRLAHDLYEMAEIVRLFLERVSSEPVSKEWDPTGSPETVWVERLYGSQPAFGNPLFLRPLIRNYGLDPSFRVKWLVEGDTEEGFILRFSKGLGANIQTYVTILNYGGDGAFIKQLDAIDAELESARKEQRFVTLTFDDSKGARNRLDGLVKKGLINFPFVMNTPDFEQANFTVEQLATVALKWASDLQQRPVRVNQMTLVQFVQARIDDKGDDFQKAFNSVLHVNGEQFKLSKGKLWGERLADYLIDERTKQGAAGTDPIQGGSKIERQIRTVLRNSEPFIDYPLSIENLDPVRLEIQ